ncbi:MAG: Asp-tRNA(Asn)/Glu-tRNA(Gln) amidotransferase subunit GatC [Spirochaetes bacterium]|jgi:aspartyl/glutamyl-tRNA(Asn/Gln) amidotransferase C subunit|nr:Asp-tRNA(Asn)/Glu-tRNA(Gln) amidotransferase subunit GatC [Spirochaetota bacterium]
MEREELLRTAELAQLDLSEEELTELSRAAEEVLDFFAVLQEVEVTADGTSQEIAASELRQDAPARVVAADDLLEAAPEVEDRLILIPNVL